MTRLIVSVTLLQSTGEHVFLCVAYAHNDDTCSAVLVQRITFCDLSRFQTWWSSVFQHFGQVSL